VNVTIALSKRSVEFFKAECIITLPL